MIESPPRIVRVKFPRFSVTFDLPEDYPDSGAPRVGVSSEDGSVARDQLYKIRSSGKTDSQSEKRSSGSHILLKIVSENRFSRKTYFYTITSRSRSSDLSRQIEQEAQKLSGNYSNLRLQ